jgi:4-hydroxyacetophenone monooxygenase
MTVTCPEKGWAQVTEARRFEDERMMGEAVARANIPTLLMVLVQLTGELQWIRAPYRPIQSRGMSDNDSGGLPDHIQEEIRRASLEAILSWRAGRPVALAAPSHQLLVEMLSCAMGEEVPAEYGPMIEAQLGQQSMVIHQRLRTSRPFEVLVVGAGIGGLCAAVNLQAAGIPFTVLEKNVTVGGTWHDNHYPGAGVDTPNHLYSFSFAEKDWTRYFALRDELHDYLEHVADEFGLRPMIQFQTEVEAACYEEEAQRWAVSVRRRDGSRGVLHANVVISATGIFNPAKIPHIKGLESFPGPHFHSTEWPAHLDLSGKRVAIIGNGASAMQIAPEIQHAVESLRIFQRSPHWAAPFEQFRKPVPRAIRYLLTQVPLYRSWYRTRLGWTFNDRVHAALQKDASWPHPDRSLNAINEGHRQYFTRYIASELGDRADLLDKVVPTYPPYGKRILMDNGWYRMLTNEKVELVTDPIVEIRSDRIITDTDRYYEADVLIVATGFDVQRFHTTFDAEGRSGRTLRQVWDDDDARAYLGLAVPDFPNFFFLYGPNTQPGHGGSIIFVLEMQMYYIMDLLRQMADKEIAVVECRRDVHDSYNERVDRAHENMVWTHTGMQTYYRNSRGRVVVNFPFRNVDFFHMTRRAALTDFITEASRGPLTASGPSHHTAAG